MAFAYPTVAIGGQNYPVLASAAAAGVYLAADPFAAKWFAADDTKRAQWLVMATRTLDRQPWAGEQVDVLAFPRTGTGVVGDDGVTIPAVIASATIELAKAFSNGYDASTKATTAGGIKRQKAGSVEQEFFAGAALEGERFPLPVMELIRAFLGGDGLGHGIGGSRSTGTCGFAPLDRDYGYAGSAIDDPIMRDYG